MKIIVSIHSFTYFHDEMMLNTAVNFGFSQKKYSYKSNIMLLGSCFSDEIGQKMSDLKIPVLKNPFGTVYNPLSIFNLLNPNFEINPAHFHKQDGVVFHHDFHSSLFDFDEKKLSEKIKIQQEITRNFLVKTDLLIITFGSSWVYELLETNKIIANCHKKPKENFVKKLLTIEQIKESFTQIYPFISPKTEILLTISPVRHTKDGMAENQLSKSLLRVACHALCEQYGTVSYLPTYEKMIDDLRDYRFYKSDLIHPNELATAIIFDEFKNAFFDKESIDLLSKIEKLILELKHRSLYGEIDSYKKFKEKLLGKLLEMNQLVDFEKEINQITST
jgi:hypothetical protein